MLQTLVLLVVLLGARPPKPPEAPRVDLYTVGPGTTVFSRFGHAALCVNDTCYNYGTADFSTPIPLGWNVLRGRGRFWVSVAPLPKMLAFYRREDRTIWKQRLPLSPDAAEGLAATLARDAEPGNREYVYNHFADNCATRPRDHINAVTGGMLARWGALAHDRTFRAMVREGLASEARLNAVSDLVMGRSIDRVPTVYEAMFLPEVLRRGVTESLGVEPELVFERKAAAAPADPMSGRNLLWKLCAPFGLALATLLLLPWPAAIGFSRGLFACLAGLGGVVFLTLAILSPVPELRWNELVLVLWPTDFVVGMASSRWLRPYLYVRTAVLVVALVLLVAGVLVQPIGPVLAFVLPPMAALAARALYESRRPADGGGLHPHPVNG